MKRLSLICIFIFPLTSSAIGKKSIELKTGVLSMNAFKNTQKNDASTSAVGTNYILPIQANYNFELFSYNFSTGLLYTPLSVEAPDKGSKSTVLYFSALWNWQVSDQIDIRIGPGYLRRQISGSGGEISLSNGLSSSTFSLPGRSVNTSNLTAEASAHYSMSNYSIGLASIVTSPASSRRSLNVLFTLGYFL